MSDNVNSMNFKQLRNEVQLLRDELAIMKRKYEDIIYNLDTDNFSSRFVKEQGNMRTAIEINAEGIKTKVSNEELKKYSTIEQTDSKISASVTETKEYAEGYVTDTLAEGEYVTNATFESQFNIYADGIYSTVEANYNSLSDDIDSVYFYASSIKQTADGISTRVWSLENGEYGEYTLFEQTSTGFKLTGDVQVTEIVQVGGNLHIGDLESRTEQKSIYFNDMAHISTFNTLADHTGIMVSSNGFQIWSKPDKIEFTDPNSGSFSSGSITLADYVSQYAGGTGGTAIAVFG